jgi:hypothetical protein
MDRPEVVSELQAAGMAVDSNPNSMGAFVDRLTYDEDDGKSFLMLNLVKLRAEANYGARPDLRPEGVTTGLEADQHYASVFLPHIFTRASHPIFISSAAHYPIMQPHGDAATHALNALYTDYDYVAVVRYRSRRDLVMSVCAVARALGPQAMSALKMSGVEHTFVIPVSAEWVSWLLAATPMVLLVLMNALCRVCWPGLCQECKNLS